MEDNDSYRYVEDIRATIKAVPEDKQVEYLLDCIFHLHYRAEWLYSEVKELRAKYAT